MDIRDVFERIGLDHDLVEELLKVGRRKSFKPGSVIMAPGNKTGEIPFVINGVLKVIRQDAQGRELLLYYLEGGETCAMSINCCLEGKSSDFKVIAEQASEIWLIPITYMDLWVQKYRSFRKFIFSAYQARFEELLQAIDSISFMKLDQRLFKYLLDQKQASGTYIIEKTHGQIANDLNTSRVVVSRLLKQLEKEEKIEQSRNRIEIL